MSVQPQARSNFPTFVSVTPLGIFKGDLKTISSHAMFVVTKADILSLFHPSPFYAKSTRITSRAMSQDETEI